MKKHSFIDQVKVFVKAGDGGDGKVSFHREKYVPKGGPDGGDGGRGGDIVLVGSKDESSLLDYKYKRHFRAKNGQPGSGSQKTGANGDHLVLKVPLGTIIKEAETGELLGEVLKDQEEWVLQQGGRGGRGNMRFATSTNRAPRECTPGEKIEGQWVQLELKILADLGFIGFPNAGKSSLLQALTNAKPKVGNYAFTTLSPNLGVLQKNDRSIRIGDIPGIIEGAHEGTGLGLQFLKHIQRTKCLLFLLSLDPEEKNDPITQFRILKEEVHNFDSDILKRPTLIVLNKVDLISKTHLNKVIGSFTDIDPIVISCKTNEGLEDLAKAIHDKV